MRKLYAFLFLGAAALRLLCVPVFVIDDDEAWSSAAAFAMKSPWQFYRSAVDHKPPGFVWFYWFVGHLAHCAADPRIVRLAFTILALVAALAVGAMARRLALARGSDAEAASRTGWCAALLYVLITALPAPKLLAVTADGLIADLVIFGYAVALFAEIPLSAVLSGVLLGAALLVKQTAVFFAIPILLARWPRRWSWKEIPLFLLGAALILMPCIWALGVGDFFYWNWTYPKEVLTVVRSRLFESDLEGFATLGLYLLAILPVAWTLRRRLGRLGDFRVLWLIAGLCGFIIGKGLFLHYLLLFAAPVALLAADTLNEGSRSIRKFPWRTFSWLGIQYVAGCLILAIPASGVFWGTDLVYFSALSRVMKASLRPGQKAMVWGGSALPLAYARVEHVTRFVLPRFAIPPYATARTQRNFHHELEQDPPQLILDLHERGDNQFDNPISSEPYVAALVRARYQLYVSPSIPWAKFYFLSPPLGKAGLVAVANDPKTYAPFPARAESWLELEDLAKGGGLDHAIDVDWALRASASLELLERQSQSDSARARARALLQELHPGQAVPAALRSGISGFLVRQAAAADGVFPVPMLSPSWWASVAMVELQPRVPGVSASPARGGAGR